MYNSKTKKQKLLYSNNNIQKLFFFIKKMIENVVNDKLYILMKLLLIMII